MHVLFSILSFVFAQMSLAVYWAGTYLCTILKHCSVHREKHNHAQRSACSCNLRCNVVWIQSSHKKQERNTERHRERENVKVIHIKLQTNSNSTIQSFQSDLKHLGWITSASTTADHQGDNSNILYKCCFHIFHSEPSGKLMAEGSRLRREAKSDGITWAATCASVHLTYKSLFLIWMCVSSFWERCASAHRIDKTCVSAYSSYAHVCVCEIQTLTDWAAVC